MSGFGGRAAAWLRTAHRAPVRTTAAVMGTPYSRSCSGATRIQSSAHRRPVAVSKKWYNYFVETPPTEAAAQPPAEGTAPPARAADLVKGAEADAELSGPVTAP